MSVPAGRRVGERSRQALVPKADSGGGLCGLVGHCPDSTIEFESFLKSVAYSPTGETVTGCTPGRSALESRATTALRVNRPAPSTIRRGTIHPAPSPGPHRLPEHGQRFRRTDDELHSRDHRRRRGGGPARPARHDALPAGAERVSAHRPREVDLPEFQHRNGLRRTLRAALRRHEPGHGERGVPGGDQGRRPLARIRLGRAPVSRLGLFP